MTCVKTEAQVKGTGVSVPVSLVVYRWRWSPKALKSQTRARRVSLKGSGGGCGMMGSFLLSSNSLGREERWRMWP